MAFIGNTNTTQAFTPAIDFFSGNGSTTAFTLSRPVASVAQVQVTIDNVAQNPSSAYTVSSNTITFTSAPLSGTNNIYVYYTSPITQVIAPGQGTVQTAQLGNITNIASGNSSLTLQTGSSNTTAITVDASQRVAFVAGTAALPTITATGDTNTGIFFPAADTIAFAEGGAEAMRIDSSGNVGIGTSSPFVKLQATGTIKIATGNSQGILSLGDGGGATTNCGVYRGAAGAPTTDGNYLNIGGYDGVVFTTGNSAIASQTERMRIDSSGNLLVGATSGSTHIIQKSSASSTVLSIINTSGTSPNGAVFNFSAAAPNNGTQTFFTTSDTGGYRGGWLSNGGIQNYQGNNSNLSDQREKKNIQLAPNYLDKICQIPVKTFLFNDQTDTDLNLGSIAQDVQAVCPELITESNWGTEEEPKIRLSIYQTDLQYALMKSIQELKAINDTQAETINALTARIVALENR